MNILKKLKEAVILLTGLGLVLLFTNISGIGCPIKWLTGISCAGCGMTRALFCAVQFQFGKALHYHPLFWMLPFLVLLYLFWEKIPENPRKGILWTVIFLFAAVYCVRILLPGDYIVTADIKSGIFFRLWNIFTGQSPGAARF